MNHRVIRTLRGPIPGLGWGDPPLPRHPTWQVVNAKLPAPGHSLAVLELAASDHRGGLRLSRRPLRLT